MAKLTKRQNPAEMQDDVRAQCTGAGDIVKFMHVGSPLGKRRLNRNSHQRSPVIKFRVNFLLMRFNFCFFSAVFPHPGVI